MRSSVSMGLQFVVAAVIAVGAFTVSFPHGIGETYQFIKFQVGHFRFGGPDLVTDINITGGFGGANLGDNIVTNMRLANTKEGEVVILKVVDNYGGAVVILDMLADTIKHTKAEVILTVKRFGLSCGTFILNQGNYLMLPEDTLLLLHMGYIVGTDGQTTRIRPGTGDPTIQSIYEQQASKDRLWLEYLSEDDKARYLDGQDVFLTGKDICDSYNGSKPPILFHYNGGCMLKGVKE